MNNHGWYFYLSAAQATQLRMLVYISLGAFILAAFFFGAPQKTQWELYATPISAPLTRNPVFTGTPRQRRRSPVGKADFTAV
jgi:hypothetical protein